MTKILMFSGSIRKESVNKKLIANAAACAQSRGAETTLIDLGDYSMPLYNGDFEAKNRPPENAKALHKLIDEHDALVIASPEYNGFPSPLLKNTIDWVSRVDVKVYDGKFAAILSASPGGLGGMRGLTHLRVLLTNLNVMVIPQQVSIGGAFEAFDEQGSIKDKKKHQMLELAMDKLLLISKVS